MCGAKATNLTKIFVLLVSFLVKSHLATFTRIMFAIKEVSNIFLLKIKIVLVRSYITHRFYVSRTGHVTPYVTSSDVHVQKVFA